MSEWGEYGVEVEGLTREQSTKLVDALPALLDELEIRGVQICRWLPPKQGDSEQ
jgi:hypothetical protein